jgi:hypothetical protein
MLTDTKQLLLLNIPCELNLVISGNNVCDLRAEVVIKDLDIPLAETVQSRAMVIPAGSIKDELDRQVALGSAEALLDTDALITDAAFRLQELVNLIQTRRGSGR